MSSTMWALAWALSGLPFAVVCTLQMRREGTWLGLIAGPCIGLMFGPVSLLMIGHDQDSQNSQAVEVGQR